VSHLAFTKIRRGTIADAELLAEVGARTFADTFAADNTAEDMANYLVQSFSIEQQSAELSDPTVTFLIAEIDHRVAGYAKLQLSPAPACVSGPNPIELSRLYVLEDWIGRGVAQVLMDECFAAAQKASRQTMWLGVWERNTRAQAFYRKVGFETVGTQSFQLGLDQQTDFVMMRPVQ
jgi:ribosomal protein S18 acetylase RimI-like enzyme